MERDDLWQDLKKVFIVLTIFSLLHECILIPAAVKNNIINIFLIESKFEIARYTYIHIYIYIYID